MGEGLIFNGERAGARPGTVTQGAVQWSVRRKGLVCATTLLGGDLIVLLVALGAALLASWVVCESVLGRPFAILDKPAELTQRLEFFLGMIAGFAAISVTRGRYFERAPYWDSVRQTFQLVCLAALIDGFIQFSLKEDFSRLWLLWTWLLAIPCLITGRIVTIWCLRKLGVWNISTLLVGPEGLRSRAKEALGADCSLGYAITSEMTELEYLESCGVQGAQKHIPGPGASYQFVVIMAGADPDNNRIDAVLRQAVAAKIPYALVPAISGLAAYELTPHYFYSEDIVLLRAEHNLARPLNCAVKRCIDLAISVICLILAAPVLLILALLVKSDGGSIIHRQERVGFQGHTFNCLKFRTMSLHTEESFQEFLDCHPDARDEWARNQKLKNDPRVTRIGRFLRRTSLDELPQLINVLSGDMSLVGPRPIVQAEIPRYQDDFDLYKGVRPGITGLWQVSGRNSLSYCERVRLDRWYVTNWSLWLDFVILVKTPRVAFFYVNGC